MFAPGRTRNGGGVVSNAGSQAGLCGRGRYRTRFGGAGKRSADRFNTLAMVWGSLLLSTTKALLRSILQGVHTCDEIAELSVQPSVSIRAVEPDHFEIPGHVFRQRHIVDGWEEGGVLIVHIQN